MRKMFMLLMIATLLTPGLLAENSRPLQAHGSAGIAISIHSVYLTINTQVRYSFKSFGIGVGLKNYIGLSFGDVNTAPYVVGAIGGLYLGLGATFRIVDPNPATSDTGFALPEADNESGVMPFITVGFSKGELSLGPGHLGFGVSLDFLPTATPVEVVDDTGNLIGDAVDSFIATGAEALFNSVKLNAGVLYTISF